MTNHAVLLKDEVVNLGKSSRNIHEYHPVEVFSAHIPTGLKRLVSGGSQTKTFVAKLVPGLNEELTDCILPPIIAELAGVSGGKITATLSGRRSAYFDTPYRINLRDLGITQEDVFQDFVLEIKGCGMLQKHSRRVSQETLLALTSASGRGYNPEEIADGLIFSRNRYLEFKHPEGTESSESANLSLFKFETFLKQGYKLAPVVAQVTFPDSVQNVAKSLDGDSVLEIKLAQEQRLMPSFIRASYFEHNPKRAGELVNKIQPDKTKQKGLLKIMLDDAVVYFTNLAKHTSYGNVGYFWDCLVNLETVFKDPQQAHTKPYAWYLAKDLVIAPTGMYFVDIEDSMSGRKVTTLETLRQEHSLYLMTCFKDLSRFFTQYAVAMNGAESLIEKQTMEKGIRKRLIDRINQSAQVHISETNEGLDVDVKYEKIGQHKYQIPSKDIPLVYAN